MKAHIDVQSPAFLVLESLPQGTAFGIVGLFDYLREFPEMGAPLGPRFPKLKGLRQLIYKSSIRIIYEYDEQDQTVYILSVQRCSQKIPDRRALKRQTPNGD